MPQPDPRHPVPAEFKELILGKTKTGAVIKRINMDHIHIDFKNIKSIGLGNILDVDSHCVNTILNSRSHLIKFRNGGELAFAYNSNGELIELCAKKVGLCISPRDELIFSINANAIE